MLVEAIGMKLKNRSYTKSEDILNTLSHLIGAIIAVCLFIFLIQKSVGDQVRLITMSFYGLAVIMMFTVSTLYHGIKNTKYRNILRRLDHAYIFILILATYTPVVFLSIKTNVAYILYGVLFGMTVIGVIFKLYFSHRFKRIITVLFVIMGWLSLLLIPSIISIGNTGLLIWLITGGVIYTIGAIVYIFAQFRYYHFVWHLFVLGGVFAHYVAMLYYV